MRLNESLLAGDLKHLVSSVFEIDSYKSKIGDDEKIVVVSFNVSEKLPAEDLSRFLELGFDFVVDADATDGPVDNGKYKVFVELTRSKKVPEQIMQILRGVSKLTNIENFRFRHYKSFKSYPADEATLSSIVPLDSKDYTFKIAENRLNNFTNFFSKSYVESIDALEDELTVKKMFSESLKFKIKDFGPTKYIYESHGGKIDVGSRAISEVLYLTKFLGNYNINKVGDSFVLENEDQALILEKIN
jgi:hypothetical protein